MWKIALNCALFIIIALGFVALFGASWLVNVFYYITIEQILFHLHFPIFGKNVPFIAYFCASVVFPSICLALILCFLPQISMRYLKREIHARIPLTIALYAYSAFYIESVFNISDFIKNRQTPSTLYESHYITPQTPQIAPDSKRNLIVILVESLETTMSAKNAIRGGAAT